jgi:hypothetical protein
MFVCRSDCKQTIRLEALRAFIGRRHEEKQAVVHFICIFLACAIDGRILVISKV